MISISLAFPAGEPPSADPVGRRGVPSLLGVQAGAGAWALSWGNIYVSIGRKNEARSRAGDVLPLRLKTSCVGITAFEPQVVKSAEIYFHGQENPRLKCKCPA